MLTLSLSQHPYEKPNTFYTLLNYNILDNVAVTRVFCADPVPGGAHRERPRVTIQTQRRAGHGLRRKLG